MANSIQVSGSIAFDTILQFQGNFKENLVYDANTALSLSFFCPGMKKEFGGCAANIAYNLRLLGQECILLGSVGSDGKEYLRKIKESGINTDFCEVHDELFTAQAIITTDAKGNQLTSFHPGAMGSAGRFGISDVITSFGIVSPNSYNAMIRHAEEFKEKNIPFIFDPGQALPMFSKEDIYRFIDLSSWVAVNEHEGDMLCDILGESLVSISERLTGHETSSLIQTLGSKGVNVFIGKEKFFIPALKTTNEIDPTGCGDAFRAGLLYGLNNRRSIHDSVKFGNAMGYIKVQSSGAQNHKTDLNKITSILSAHNS